MEVSDLKKALKMLSDAKETALFAADFNIKNPVLKEIYIKAIEEGDAICKKYLNKAMKWEN